MQKERNSIWKELEGEKWQQPTIHIVNVTKQGVTRSEKVTAYTVGKGKVAMETEEHKHENAHSTRVKRGTSEDNGSSKRPKGGPRQGTVSGGTYKNHNKRRHRKDNDKERQAYANLREHCRE